VPTSLESQIDDLYATPLSDFIAARDALAKSIGGDEAKRIRKLPKPTLVPWAVNQVYWKARPVYDRLIKTGARLRAAQVAALEGRKGDVRAASDAHRQAIAEAVQEAEKIAAAEGSHPPADALMRTFESISLAPDTTERPGRLTKSLQPAGFEALAGVKVAPTIVAKAERETAKREHEARQSEARQRVETRREEAERKKREAAVRKAEAQLERARRQMAEAEAALKRTRGQTS